MYSIGELASKLELEFSGLEQRSITGLAPLATAGPDDLAFISGRKFLSSLADTQAGVVILHPDFIEQCPVDYLISQDPYLSFARATHFFDRATSSPPGIHASAVVSADSEVHPTASVGANVCVEAGAFLGAGVVLDSGVYVGRNSRVGARTRIYPNVVIYDDVHLGEDCLVQSQTALGSDGFGYAPSADGWVKICQLGGVRVGDRVEIGAGATIDRGALEHTVIGDGVIIDNQVHIAHNCSIGKNTAIAACCGVAGSTKIGANCTFGGMVGVNGHIEICDNAHFSAKTMVLGSVTQPGSYSSGTGMSPSREWRKNAVRFSQLDAIQRRVVKLENQKKP
jgi:UDP-3-O-[3-hydroxymyristoyl] glucosamine N-acyltransferase